MIRTALILGAVLAASPDVEKAEKLAAAGSCDDLMALAGDAKPKGGADDVALAHAFVKAAPSCGAQDKVLGLGLTERAFLLAPQDAVVVTAHAEQLIAADQRGEAASVLDRLLTRPGGDARRARIVRGQLARDEGEYELAVRVLDPIQNDSEYGEKAREISADAQTKLAEKSESAKKLADLQRSSDAAAVQAIEATNSAQVSRAPSNHVVWHTGDRVSRAGDRTFSAKGTKKGQPYVFRSIGSCQKHRNIRRAWGVRAAPLEDPEAMVFGIDFRVSIGGGDPVVLRTGESEQTGEETTAIPFTASADNVSIRVFDRSDASQPMNCYIHGIAVTTP